MNEVTPDIEHPTCSSNLFFGGWGRGCIMYALILLLVSWNNACIDW